MVAAGEEAQPQVFDLAVDDSDGEDQWTRRSLNGQPRGGRGIRLSGRGMSRGGRSRTSLHNVVHHHPPRENAADIGYPVRGGQTLLIAYFPWEASEADIEREFTKFCRVKRVHLVVDKSSRKQRCFGFVKFMSKADAEEALRATMQGLVQLPDTRGHVWHLKAEWTKTGDMVVDDSETELEVARRKEERRFRGPGGSGPCLPVGNFDPDGYDLPGDEPRLRHSPTAPVGLHPGVPAPLPPLISRHALVALAQQARSQQQLLPASCQSPGQPLQQSFQGTHAPSVYSGLGAGVAPMPHDTVQQHQAHAFLRESLGAGQGYMQASPSYAPQGYLSGQASFPPGMPGQPSYGPNGQQVLQASAEAAARAFLSQTLQQQAFSSYSLGQQSLVQQPPPQHGVQPGHSSQRGTYGYIQQPSVAPPAPAPVQSPGIVTYNGYTGGAATATAVQESMAGAAHVMLSSSPQPQQQQVHAQQPARVSGTSPHPPGDGTDARYLEAVWQLSEMSLDDKGKLDPPASGQPQPATLVPPTQQPPAPPAGWKGEAFTATSPAGAREGEWRAGVTQPATVPSGQSGRSGGPAAVWNSFDDAAAKGMVDGLVGREDCRPPVTAWRKTMHAA